MKLSEEQLNDPHLFDDVSESEKLESLERATCLNNGYLATRTNPINCRLKRKKKKNSGKIKFSTINHPNNKR